MAKPCPKCGYKRRKTDRTPENECPQCGAIYGRIQSTPKKTEPEKNAESSEITESFNDSDTTNLTNQAENKTTVQHNSAAVYEMLWRCDFCGADKLLGKSQRFCPHCGAPQNPDNRYFPNDEDLVIVNGTTYYGVDILCSACRVANPANNVFCVQCGSSLQNGAQVTLKQDNETAGKKSVTVKKKSPWLIAVVVLLLAGIGFFVLDFFWRETVDLQLTLAQWEREIKIEKFQAVHESEWCTAMPSNAYAVSKSSEIRSYRQIPNGETCSTERVDRGDGTFTTQKRCTTKYRDEPVYADKCHYTVDRWQYQRSLYANGKDRQPHDPDLVLINPGSCLGCEREAAHIAKYILTFLNPAKTEEPVVCEVPFAVWEQAVLPSQWRMEVSVMSGVTHCDTLALTTSATNLNRDKM